MNDLYLHYKNYESPTKEQVEQARQRMRDGIEEQNAAREKERERSRMSAKAYEERWNEYFKSLGLEDEIEIPCVITHRDGRTEKGTIKVKP